MKHLIRVIRQPAALTLALLLTACGGGGGGGGGGGTPAPAPNPAPVPVPTPPPAATPAPACNITIAGDSTVSAGKTAGLAALSACPAPISNIVWTQVSGPTVTLAASRSPTVSIETAEAGVIALRADATLADGRISSATTSINVAPAPSGSYVTVRADHALRVDTQTSLRAWPVLAGTDTFTKIVWTQVSGPTVEIKTDELDSTVMFFTAPASVTADTALTFRATMTTSAGTDSDDVIVAVDRQAARPDGYIFEQTARVHAYLASSPYAGVLARCAYDVSLYYTNTGASNLCSASTLPLLQGEVGEGGIPSVAQVMNRVVVSHDFLGKNFEAFLNSQDVNADFRRMLGGVTAIVIGSHVRPSFYQPHTGAIYLDADYLWLTPQQRDVVTEVPDYRLAFSEGLNFTGVGRQVKNNNFARGRFDVEDRKTRPEGELLFGLGRLMYHELAHAADFFQPGQRTLNGAQSILANLIPRYSAETLPSDFLAREFPLRSAEMKRLGQVLYQGATPTQAEKEYTAAQVGSFFGADIANDDYAYSIFEESNSREDLAMLFEEFMMSYRHGVQYDVGYTNRILPTTTEAEVIVAWGQRGRIGTPAIKERLKTVVARIAPWISPSAIDALPAPIQMVPGKKWYSDETLVLNGAPQPARFKFSRPVEKPGRLREDMRTRLHAH